MQLRSRGFGVSYEFMTNLFAEARSYGVALVLDVQPGRSPVEEEVEYLLPLLAEQFHRPSARSSAIEWRTAPLAAMPLAGRGCDVRIPGAATRPRLASVRLRVEISSRLRVFPRATCRLAAETGLDHDAGGC
jgi:hypothetical protein